MKEYVLFTDSGCDLPVEVLKERGIELIEMGCTIDGLSFSLLGGDLTIEQFYGRMRDGSMPITAQINPAAFEEAFTPFLEKGMGVLYLGFSSGLSGTYASAVMAAEELSGKYPDAKVVTVDTKCASLGQGLLVYEAADLRDKGMSMEEVARFAQDNCQRYCHYFTVDNLFHLHRGGRVSRATAIMGTMLSIKPVLHVDEAGHLINFSKARGRKASLNALVDNMKKKFRPELGSTVFISHGDCREDADMVASAVKAAFPQADVKLIGFIGPVIGTHSGPGTVALFFKSDDRSL